MSTWNSLYDFRDGYYFLKSDGSGPYAISSAGVATLITAPGVAPTGGLFGYPGAFGTLANGTPVVVSLANVSLPRKVFVAPVSGDTVSVEAYDGVSWTAWTAGTVGVYTSQDIVPGTPVFQSLRFTRVSGSGTTSSYGVMADAAAITPSSSKNTTANRPTGLGTANAGTIYFDTTLAANGKPIFWTGTQWVDSTGTAV